MAISNLYLQPELTIHSTLCLTQNLLNKYKYTNTLNYIAKAIVLKFQPNVRSEYQIVLHIHHNGHFYAILSSESNEEYFRSYWFALFSLKHSVVKNSSSFSCTYDELIKIMEISNSLI